MSRNELVRVEDLSVTFAVGGTQIRAVNGIDLALDRGEVLALLGESGCGKSVTLRALMRLLPLRTARIGGRVEVDGRNVLTMRPGELRAYRGGTVSMVFQEPGLAFDPVFRVGDQITEAIVRHEPMSQKQARARALDLFERVRIPSAARRLDNYPHELSGGMRQRAMIAMALACRPKLLLADEPTTSLDATVQIQILLLLRELQRELGLAVIFVTHDIGVATEIADKIAVMYAGRIVERGPVRDVILSPGHPYTQGLLASRADAALVKGRRLHAIPGAPPDPAAVPPGCAFAPRCTYALPACTADVPPNVNLAAAHEMECIRPHETLAAHPILVRAPPSRYELPVRPR